MNDIPPVFTSVPRPITLDDDVPIGTTVIDLVAADSDGTAPGNQVGVLISFQYLISSPLNKQGDGFSGIRRFVTISSAAASPASIS